MSAIIDLWKGQGLNDGLTVLYYLYLLHVKHGRDDPETVSSFREQLEELTTIAARNLEDILIQLDRSDAFTDPFKCYLTQEALSELETAFSKTFGTRDPEILRYNGLELQTGSESFRISNWVDAVTNDLTDLFSGVEDLDPIEIEEKAERKSKRLVRLVSGGKRPILSFLLMSTSAISQTSEYEPLTVDELRIRDMVDRLRRRSPEIYPLDRPVYLGVIGAIRYKPAVAHQIMSEGRHSTGPINFEALYHYLHDRELIPGRHGETEEVEENNRKIRTVQYDAMLEAIFRSAPGVVNWFSLLRHIERQASETYAAMGMLRTDDDIECDRDWKRWLNLAEML